MLTGTNKLLGTGSCGNRTTERRPTIYISTARKSYLTFYISSIGLLRGSVNPADYFTKVCGNGRLRLILEMGSDDTPVD